MMVWEDDEGGKSHNLVSGKVLECDDTGNSDEAAGSN